MAACWRRVRSCTGPGLYLVVQLPDGMRGTIPASVTDVFGEPQAAGPGVVLDAGGVRRLRALALVLGGRDGAGP
jgi:hypothetical protein